MEFKIREAFEYYENTIGKLNEVRIKDVFKYNNQQIGGSSLNESDAFNTVTSPYMDGLNRILDKVLC